MCATILHRILLLILVCVAFPLIMESLAFAQGEAASGSDKNISDVSSVPGESTQEALTDEMIQAWIRELGSNSVDVREKAADQLYRAGSAALPLLKDSSKSSDDLEVKSRSAAIATAIENDDMGLRVDQFLRDADITKTYGLNGWPNFSKVVGTGRLAKRLFKEVIDTYPSFAEDGFAEEDRLLVETERIGREILFSQRKGEEARLGDVVTLMYASVRLKEKVPRDIELTTSTLTRRAPFPQEIQSSALATPLKALFREWIKTVSSEPQMTMIVCMELGLEDGKAIARKTLEDKQIGPDLYEIAMSCMMRFATSEDFPWIEPWIADERGLKPAQRVVTNIPMRQIPAPFGGPGTEKVEGKAPFTPTIEEVQVQYRDLALVAGLKVLNEEIATYYPRAQWHPYRGYLATTLALPIKDPSNREAAIAKWKELRNAFESAKGNEAQKILPPQELR